MLYMITNKHVPTSARTAAQISGCPANARHTIASFVTTEKAMFILIVQSVLLANLIALGILRMSFDIRVMWLVSIATAEPDTPMETPTSALANAGASFMPSPIISVGPSFSFSSSTILTLSSGSSSE
jgi:hypothetical protein